MEEPENKVLNFDLIDKFIKLRENFTRENQKEYWNTLDGVIKTFTKLAEQIATIINYKNSVDLVQVMVNGAYCSIDKFIKSDVKPIDFFSIVMIKEVKVYCKNLRKAEIV